VDHDRTGRRSVDAPDEVEKGRLLAGALIELLVWAVEARITPPPAEIERLFLAMAAATLRVLPE
jgi:hypothetical protein